MEQFLPFIIKHWALVSAFVAIALLLVVLELRERRGGIFKLTPQQAVNALNHKNAKVFDFRPANYFKDGHIIGAVNLSIKELESQGRKLQKYRKRPIILLFNGAQTNPTKVVSLLRENSFQDISLLAGGLEAWRAANLPLQKD